MQADRYGKLEFFASCPKGLERIVAGELDVLGISGVRPLTSGVSFRATIRQACEAMMWLRCASRVLLVLARVPASNSEELYESCRSIEWEEHVRSGCTIAVHAKGTSKSLSNSRFTALRVKDAICDRLVEVRGSRPDVDASSPDVPVRVTLHRDRATVSLDLCGAPLHQRGYRVADGSVAASLKETLAAALLISGGWPELARLGGVLVDPFCGSGTIAIEGAMIAGDIAPGIMRHGWAIENMSWFDRSILDEIVDEADSRMEAGFGSIPPIFASDINPAAVKTAAASARRAGLSGAIEFSCADIAHLDKPEALSSSSGALLATNPPYGERILDTSRLVPLMSALRAWIASARLGDGVSWDVSLIVPGSMSDAVLGSSPRNVVETFNGPLEVTIRSYSGLLGADGAAGCGNTGSTYEDTLDIDMSGEPSRASVYPELESQVEQFSNRLSKMAKHRSKWARRNEVTCYRVYDADLPDFNISVDLYQGAGAQSGKRWVQVCEYAPPRSVDADLAAARAARAVEVVRDQFDLDATDVFFKRRIRSKGGSQYSDIGVGRSRRECGAGAPKVILEGGHLFEISLDSGLDTGIFLDGREIRKMIGEISRGKSFLNLFAYTGTATVYAAGGGAASTLTVDMSQTYLDWARRNMSLNCMDGPEHAYERADVIRWVNDTRHSSRRFDLVYVDPPTFSNSKKMGSRTWDVQRDHAELLIDVSRILTKGGQAIFCCNLRGFEPDVDKLAHAGVGLIDISERTIPEDFSRNSRIHHCYILRRLPTS